MALARLEVESLTCARGGRIVLSGVSFALASGEAALVRGPNGAGKTTLLRTLAGFLPASSGRIRIYDNETAGDKNPSNNDHAAFDSRLSDYCNYFAHANAVKGRLSVLENVQFWQSFFRDESTGGGKFDGAKRTEAELALEAFDLLDLADFRAAHLSQGQSRRLGLARLLVSKRDIWLMDEPSASLDAASAASLEGVIARHLSTGGMAIIATHSDLRLPGVKTLDLTSNDDNAQLAQNIEGLEVSGVDDFRKSDPFPAANPGAA